MKKVYFILTCVFFYEAAFSQCGSSTCPPASITTLPASGSTLAGNYCISGTVNDPSNTYTITGALTIQSGTVTLGSITVDKIGSIVVMPGAKLILGALTGETTSPASTIPNITVCSGGYLSMTGAMNPGEINFVLNDYGVMLVTGSWTTSPTDTYFKIGMGSLVEMCNSFTFNDNGFFTETSTSPSYLVTRASVSNSTINGWLSKSTSGSNIKWSALGGPPAFVSAPAGSPCLSSCSAFYPPGATDNGICGSIANSYIISVLPVGILDASAQSSDGSLVITADIAEDLPVSTVMLESSADGQAFVSTAYVPVDFFTEGEMRYRWTLPAAMAGNYYRVHVISGVTSFYSVILPTTAQSTTVGPGAKVYPDPATNFVYLSRPAAGNYTSASVINSMGQLLQEITLPVGGDVVRCDLPGRLSAGIYFIRFTGTGIAPLTVRVVKTP